MRPDRAACCVNRSRTNTPLQALTLLNDPAYVEMSLALGRRMASDRPEIDDRGKIEYGFRLTMGRQPTSEEVSQLLDLFERQRTRFADDESAARSLTGEAKLSGDELRRLAAWCCVATTLLNLDETITRN